MLVKSATRLNNISQLRSETRWNRLSRLVPLLKSRTAHYISLAVYSFSHFFFFSFFLIFLSDVQPRLRNVEVNAWRTKRDRRDEISETGCYLLLASLMREACVTRFYASGDPVDDEIPHFARLTPGRRSDSRDSVIPDWIAYSWLNWCHR